MANDKNVSAITSREDDFAQWYTDIVRKAELADYSSVRGCIVFMPYGYGIWELIEKAADKRFKDTGHVNVRMPMLIPEGLIQKEKDHVEGFAPEMAWVTHGGSEKLQERLCIRPTSETLFCEHYANVIHSWRDLPKLYNQWVSVVRWEKTTRPFLRNVEFLWQEGHTAHATAEEAQEETLRMLDVYADIAENVLAMPVIKGIKTEREKFAGANATYGIECLMYDGKALQAGTTHNFGDGFARAFNIQYTDKNNKLQYVHQTSWGISTRLIGGLIMSHGDDNGLVLPPAVAPDQAVIVPVAQEKPGVLERAAEVRQRVAGAGIRVRLDDSDKSPGWKFAEHEMRGVPVRVEMGPRDIAAGQAVLARRDTGAKTVVPLDGIERAVADLLDDIARNMYNSAKKRMADKTYTAKDMGEFERVINETPGFIKAMWCGDPACEETIKERTAATSRCMPFEQEHISDTCVCCGKKADKMVYWAKAY